MFSRLCKIVLNVLATLVVANAIAFCVGTLVAIGFGIPYGLFVAACVAFFVFFAAL